MDNRPHGPMLQLRSIEELFECSIPGGSFKLSALFYSGIGDGFVFMFSLGYREQGKIMAHGSS